MARLHTARLVDDNARLTNELQRHERALAEVSLAESLLLFDLSFIDLATSARRSTCITRRCRGLFFSIRFDSEKRIDSLISWLELSHKLQLQRHAKLNLQAIYSSLRFFDLHLLSFLFLNFVDEKKTISKRTVVQAQRAAAQAADTARDTATRHAEQVYSCVFPKK